MNLQLLQHFYDIRYVYGLLSRTDCNSCVCCEVMELFN